MNDNYFPGYFLDTDVLPDTPAELFAKGVVNAKAMIVGHTSKDGTAAFYGDAPLVNTTGEAAYVKHMAMAWKGKTAANGSALLPLVLAQYPLARFNGSVSSAFLQADADATVICPSHALAHTLMTRGSSDATGEGATELHTARSIIPTFVFNFAHFQASGCDDCVGLGTVRVGTSAATNWACHGSDTKHVFGSEWGPDPNGPYNGVNPRIHCPHNGTNELALTESMQGLWAAFATWELPSTPAKSGDLLWGGVKWPLYLRSQATASVSKTLQFAAAGAEGGIVVIDSYKSADCAFWEEVHGDKSGGRSRA
jgi:hypothetical protein